MSRNNTGLTTPFTALSEVPAHSICAYGPEDFTAVRADGSAPLLGVSTDISAAVGQHFDVVRSGVAPVRYGAAINRGQPVMANADSAAVPAMDGHDAIGFAEVSGIAGDIGAIHVFRTDGAIGAVAEPPAEADILALRDAMIAAIFPAEDAPYGMAVDFTELGSRFSDAAMMVSAQTGDRVRVIGDLSGHGHHVIAPDADADADIGTAVEDGVAMDGTNRYRTVGNFSPASRVVTALTVYRRTGSGIQCAFTNGTNQNTQDGYYSERAVAAASANYPNATIRSGGVTYSQFNSENGHVYFPNMLLASMTVFDTEAPTQTQQVRRKINGLPIYNISHQGAGPVAAGDLGGYPLWIGSASAQQRLTGVMSMHVEVAGELTPAQIAAWEAYVKAAFPAAHIEHNIRTDGDSGTAGSGGVWPSLSRAQQTGRVVITTASGGSTIQAVRDRITDPSNAHLLRAVHVIFDSVANGYNESYVTDYTAVINAILAGGGRVLVIPEAVPYGSSESTRLQAESIRDAQAAIAATDPRISVLDWRDVWTHTGGVIDLNQMLDYPADTQHYNEAAHDALSVVIADRLDQLGWL